MRPVPPQFGRPDCRTSLSITTVSWSVRKLCTRLWIVPVVALLGVSSAEAICGDVNASGTLTAGDALAVLRRSVGLPIALTCPAPGGPLKTGWTSCVDSVGSSIDCAGTGQDGEMQSGVPRSFADGNDGTIIDLATGLMWEKLSNDASIHDRDISYDRTGMYEKILQLNASSYAGYSDWRVPNEFELYTLVNFAAISPATFPEFDHDCVEGCAVTDCSCTAFGETAGYGSSTTAIGFDALVWKVNFTDGNHAIGSGGGHVRAVRTAAW